MVLISDSPSPQACDQALQVVNNWRSSHSFPLNTFQMGLRNRAQQVDHAFVVAQRLKRLESITFKLANEGTMKLSRMQDIGGCRAIVATTDQVHGLRDMYLNSDLKHRLIRADDYIVEPKQSGYRSLHLVYKYISDRSGTYNGLQIEVQLRSQLQHAWATAVETVGTFVRQALKASQGSEEWLRFFSLMGSALAIRENTPLVPGTPSSQAQLIRELRLHVEHLGVPEKLRGYHAALRIMDMPDAKEAHYFILEQRADERRIVVHSFRKDDLQRATDEYLRVERSLRAPGSEAVLVSVDSLSALRRAYPNYFLDTKVFLEAVQHAIA